MLRILHRPFHSPETPHHPGSAVAVCCRCVLLIYGVWVVGGLLASAARSPILYSGGRVSVSTMSPGILLCYSLCV